MTDEERKNRNPAPEAQRIAHAEIEAMPLVEPSQLELHRVYLVQSPRYIVTINYAGPVHSLHPKTLDAIVVHRFHGPRNGLRFGLVSTGGGWYTDVDGTKIAVRLWTGADAE